MVRKVVSDLPKPYNESESDQHTEKNHGIFVDFIGQRLEPRPPFRCGKITSVANVKATTSRVEGDQNNLISTKIDA
jgi:hypothetical protein